MTGEALMLHEIAASGGAAGGSLLDISCQAAELRTLSGRFRNSQPVAQAHMSEDGILVSFPKAIAFQARHSGIHPS